jgi:hypothetical protein
MDVLPKFLTRYLSLKEFRNEIGTASLFGSRSASIRRRTITHNKR